MNEPARSHGVNAIASAFASTRAAGRAALMPYFTLGYPDSESSVKIIESFAVHSDLLELGIPFSDPLADGPTIQRSTQISLEGGTTTAKCLEMLSTLRSRGLSVPVTLMGYYNPMLAYGEDRFVRDAAEAGADGLIVPDLPPEEAAGLAAAADESGIALIYFLAPTSSDSRAASITKRARGFIYLVSVTGVTGARKGLDPGLQSFVARVRRQTDLPLAIGFGISTPKQAASVGSIADGVIVGSALIDAVDAAEDKPRAAAAYVRTLQAALLP